MEFIITVISGIYSYYSFIQLKSNQTNLSNNKWKNNKEFLDISDDINVKAFSLNIYEQNNYPLLYIGIYCYIPINDSKNVKYVEIYNKFSSKNNILENYKFLDKYENEYYIESYSSLQNYLTNYDNIPDLIIMPIKVKQTNFIPIVYYTSFKTKIFLTEYNFVSTDVNRLIYYSTLKKRNPLSFTSGIICIFGLGYICFK